MCDSQKYLEYFSKEKVLFATNGDCLKTPSIIWSKQTYINIAKNQYTVKSDIWALDCFLEILKYAHERKIKYVIYIDADCFIVNVVNLKNMFVKFQNEGFVFAGMPDGGCIPIRIHNKFLINPFFSMFNVKKCMDNLNKIQLTNVKPLNRLDANNLNYLEMILAKCPNAYESKFQIDNHENYYKLFTALAFNQKIMYLIASQLNHNKNPITAIYNDKALEQNIVCLHSWYARKNDQQNLERIKSVYELSKTIKSKYEQL